MTSPNSKSGLPEGTVVGGRYRIVREIGSGGMGVVYEAVHDRLGHRLALKVLSGDLARSPDLAIRLEREAKTLARLESPHIARVVDVDVAGDGLPFMAMELLVGSDLDDEIVKRQAIPWREAAGYVLQACEAMKAAHAHGIVHRDLKPANLFLHETGGARVVKVLDFGISKLTAAQDVGLTLTQSPIGTPLYMSPEQMTRPKDVDVRTDVWALGVVLYELVTGVVPFEAETPQAVAILIATKEPEPMSSIVRDVPPALEAVVRRALQKTAADRFQTVAELAAAINAALRGSEASIPLGATVPPATPSSNEARARDPSLEQTVVAPTAAAPRQRSSTMVWIACGVGVVLAGPAIWLAARDGSGATGPQPKPEATATLTATATPTSAEPSPPSVTPAPSGAASVSAAPSASGSSAAGAPSASATPRPGPRRTGDPTPVETPPTSTGRPKPPTRL
ncbi:MAG: serine/threonine protein kinase [Polyangiaceae bacterium]|nr:serine/threonine protein kinase [Polyangiaceae bacterium]